MLTPATPLQRFFRENQKCCPHDYRFSVKELVGQCPDFTEADPFYRTACVFVEVFAGLRKRLLPLPIFESPAENLADRCVTMVNRDAILAYREHSAALENSARGVAHDLFSVLGNRSVTTAAGSRLNLDEAFPALADPLQTMLEALPHLAKPTTENPIDETSDLFAEKFREFTLLTNAFDVIKGDWERALWLDFRFSGTERVLAAQSEPFARVLRANFLRYYDREVREVEALKAATGASRASEAGVLGQTPVDTLLTCFKNARLDGTVPLEDVVRSFLYLRTAAEGILNNAASVEAALASTAVPCVTLIEDISAALELPVERVAGALGFLTFKTQERINIWTAPIYQSRESAVLILPALAFANETRFIELAAIRGEVGFDKIGKHYEGVVQKRARAALKKNRFSGVVKLGKPRHFAAGGESEEVDLTMSIGTTLFVVEIKYDHIPTEPRETYKFIRAKNAACGQAARKAKFIARHLDTFKRRDLIGKDVASVFPLVLSSAMLLSGASVDGVPMIDEAILGDYLNNSQGDVQLAGNRIVHGSLFAKTYYESEEAFEQRARTYFMQPPQLQQFERLLVEVNFTRRGYLVDHGYDLVMFDLAAQG